MATNLLRLLCYCRNRHDHFLDVLQLTRQDENHFPSETESRHFRHKNEFPSVSPYLSRH